MVLLNFFEPSSQRLPPGPEQTTVDDYEDDESRWSKHVEDASNHMQQQHPIESILHSKFETNGQQSTRSDRLATIKIVGNLKAT